MSKQTLLLINCFLLASCLFSQSKNKTEFPLQLLISEQDLPEMWFKTSDYELSNEPGNKEYLVQFGLSEDLEDSDLISHDIVIRDELEKANNVFEKFEELWFSHEYNIQVNINFEPINANDRHQLRCEERNENIAGCSFLQQHENIVSLTLATIDGQNISLKEFEILIHKLDERLQEYKP